MNDDTGVAVRRSPARLATIDQRDRVAVALEMKGATDSNDSSTDHRHPARQRVSGLITQGHPFNHLPIVTVLPARSHPYLALAPSVKWRLRRNLRIYIRPPSEGRAMWFTSWEADRWRVGEVMWGQHLILDMCGCDREAISDAAHIRAFSAELVEAIEMKAYGEPVLEHFATQNPDAAGYTLVQLIETSNITAHFAELTGDVYLDVFSCKAFPEETAIAVCQMYFKPREINRTSLMRGVKPDVSDAA